MRKSVTISKSRSYLSVIVPVLCLMLLAMGCSTLSVQYDYDTNANFASLKTYDWLPIPVKANISELAVKRIRNAVDTQLEAKGLKRTSENPDFLIAAHIGKEEKVSVVDWGYSYGPYDRYGGYGYSPYNRYWGGHRGPSRVSSYKYEEGTLILDFIYAESRKMFWRGVATAELDERPTPEKQQKKINKAVEKILENFPPVKDK